VTGFEARFVDAPTSPATQHPDGRLRPRDQNPEQGLDRTCRRERTLSQVSTALAPTQPTGPLGARTLISFELVSCCVRWGLQSLFARVAFYFLLHTLLCGQTFYHEASLQSDLHTPRTQGHSPPLTAVACPGLGTHPCSGVRISLGRPGRSSWESLLSAAGHGTINECARRHPTRSSARGRGGVWGRGRLGVGGAGLGRRKPPA
jgi:hypothetical protein